MKLLLIPLVCISICLQAQEPLSHTYGPTSQIRFSIMPALYNNLSYENVGQPLFKSSLGLGGEFVVSYRQVFWKGFGINVGAGIGMVPYNFSFDLVTDTSSIIAGDDGTLGQFPQKRAVWLFTFPVLLEKKLLLIPADRVFLSLEAGIKWNMLPSGFHSSGGSYWTQTGDGEDVRYFEYSFNSVEEMEFISYVFKAGLHKINRRGNSFCLNMVFQRSPSSMLTGTYQFNELGFESSGTMELHNSYIGMELIYGLSLGGKSTNSF